jgi:hypothetical protein
VARVGDELPQAALAVLTRLERAADVVQHPVQRAGDLADLRTRVHVTDPLRELDLAAVQRQRAHLRRGLGHPLQGPQLAADQHGTRDPATEQRDTDRDDLDDDQPRDDVLGPARGLTDDVGRPTGLRGHHAVVTDRQVDGRRTRTDRHREEGGVVDRRDRGRPAAPAAHLRPLHDAVADRRADGARALDRAEEVLRGRAVVEAVRRHEPAGLGRDEAGVRVDHLAVQAAVQELAQRQRRRHPHDRQDDREQHQYGRHEPCPQRVRPGGRPHRPPQSDAGLST